MENINERYLINRISHSDLFGTLCNVSDSLRYNNLLELHLLANTADTNELISYLKDNFIRVSQMFHPHIRRYRHFTRVQRIDDMPVQTERYLLTSDEPRSTYHIDDIREDLTFEDITRIVCELASALQFLHDRQFCFGSLSPETLVFFRRDESWHVQYIGLPIPDHLTKCLYRHGHVSYARILHGDVKMSVVQNDLASLGLLFFSLLAKSPISYKEFGALFEVTYKNFVDHAELQKERKCMSMISRLIRLDILPEDQMEPTDIIRAINEQFNQKNVLYAHNANSRIQSRIPLIDHTGQYQAMINQGISHLKSSKTLRLQIIKGIAGTGKTRMLEEIQYRCEMAGISVYSVGIDDTKSSNSCIEIARSMLSYPDTDLIQKYGSELIKVFPGMASLANLKASPLLDAQQEEARLRSRLMGFITDTIKKRPTVILMDNINQYDDVCMSSIDLLLQRIKNRACWIVLTHNMDKSSLQDAHLDKWEETMGIHQYELGNFEPEDAYSFMVALMGLRRKAKLFSDHIYRETDGNPGLIRKMLFVLAQEKLLYLDATGRWSTNYDALHDYRQLKTTSSYEESLLDGVRDMSDEKKQILHVLAIMLNPVPLHVIADMMQADVQHITEILSELTDSQLIMQQANDFGYTFGIKYGAQKTSLLQDESEDIILQRHQEAVKVISNLMATGGYDLTDELIFQAEFAGEYSHVVELCSEAADRMIKMGAMQQALNYLDTGLRISRETTDHEGLGKLLFKKAEICSNSGMFDDAMHLLREARDIFFEDGNLESHLHAGLELFHACFEGDKIAEAERILAEIERDALVTNLVNSECNICLCKSEILKASGNPESALSVVMRGLDHYIAESDAMLLGRLYEAVGTYNGDLYRFEEAMYYHQKAVKIYESLDALIPLAKAYLAIGIIYANIPMDSTHAREYFEKALTIAQDHQLSNIIANALNNIGDTLALEDRFREAITYFEQSMSVAEENRFISILIFPLMNLLEFWARIGDYKAAYEHLKKAESVIRTNEVSPLSVAYLAQYAAHYYYHVNDREHSLRESRRALNVLKNSPDAWESEVYEFLCLPVSLLTQGDVNFRQFDERITHMDAARRKRAMWIELSNRALQLGRKQDAQHFLKCIAKTEKPVSPVQQQEIAYLRISICSDNERLLKLERFIRQLPDDSLRLRGQCARDLFHLHLLYGDAHVALQQGIYALDAISMQLEHIPDEHVQTYLTGCDAISLYREVGTLHGNLHKIQINLLDDEETLENIQGHSMRKSWTTAMVSHHSEDKASGQNILKKFEAELQSEEPIGALISSVAQYVNASWWFLAQTTSESTIKIYEKNPEMQNEIASALAEEYITRTGVFYDLNLNMALDRHALLPDGTTAVLGLTLFPEQIAGNTIQANRRKSSQQNFRKGVLLFGTNRIFNHFSDDTADVLKSLEPLIALLLENHILKSISNIDRLTGLYSRKYMEEALNIYFTSARETQEPLSILMMDIDRFKVVNDKFGHQKGDEVLHAVSAIVMKNCRRQDICCRYGGEELLVLLPDTGVKQARVIAERIRRNIESTEMLENHPITISTGVSTFPLHGEFQDDVVSHADLALYRAKQTGRNKTCVYSRSMRKTVHQNNKIETTDLYLLLQNERILHNYNAIFTYMTRKMDHNERIQAILDRMSNVIPADHIVFIDAASTFRKEMPKMIYLHQSLVAEGILDTVLSLPLIRSALRAKAIKTSVEWGKMKDQQLQEVSRMAVPVMCRDEVRGVLYFHISVNSYEYERKDQNIATLFSNLIGLGLPEKTSTKRKVKKRSK